MSVNKRALDFSSSSAKEQRSSLSSASCSNSQWKYDVFLSFRGEDTRNNFTGHLYAALDLRGIYTFKDDKRLEKGTDISPELLQAIESSRFSIIILSKNYASSTWCLEELAKIVECMDTEKSNVVPVFYQVDPSEVRKQRGEFKTDFDRHEQDFRDNLNKVKRWRSALTRVASISGWHSKDRSEADLIKDIVDDISRKVNKSFWSDGGDLVGIDSRVKKIYELLETECDDIRFVGICGMGGIGKTTLARAVHERLQNKYKGSCFLENVREVSGKSGLAYLQEILLYEFLKDTNLKIYDYHEGINLIRRRLCRKKVFLVLDDVHQLEQLEGLAGRDDWFGPGSRIVVTTRDEHVLVSHGIDRIYKPEGLYYNEAHRLFVSKAFKHIQPTNDHVELIHHALGYAKGLPLALKVLGSFLCDRSVHEWKSELEKLQEVPNENIVKILRISYDGLDKIEKKIFLDVACFFNGKDKDRTMKILNGCNFYPDIGLRVLVEKCLITIAENKLQMHDLIQEMGWEIVREQHPSEPGKWSRLWLYEDVYYVLAKNMGTPAVEAIIPVGQREEITHLNGQSFSTLSNLRLLIISNVHLSEDIEYLSNELRFLKWQGYPLKSLPSSFQPQKLFQLSLCYSRIEYLWKGVKPFRELKTIKLSYSRNLIRTPDFTMVPNLARLDLQYCTKLHEVDQSVGFLRRLIVLNLDKCESLVQFPSNVSGLKSLKILNLHGCSKLDTLPLNLGQVEHLEELDVSGTAIRQVPSSIVQLTNLKTLSLRGCKGEPPKTWSFSLWSWMLPTRKPDCIGLLLPPLAGLSVLKTLDISDCNLSDGAIPNDFGSLFSLEELKLSGNNFVSLPDCISQLSKLKILCLEKCQKLQSLPKLPPEIMFLGAEDCTSLKTISSALELTSQEIALHFFNCFQLLLETQDMNNSLVILLLKRWLQINEMSNHDPMLQEISNHDPMLQEPPSFPSHQFHIRLPGSEIPGFFCCRREGSSVDGRLPSGWLNDEFMGFAVCAVFALPDHSDDVEIKGYIATRLGSSNFSFSYRGFTTIDSDHLWLGYLSRDIFHHNIITTSNGGEGVFVFFNVSWGENAFNSLVKRCGVRLVYKQDVENFEQTDGSITRVDPGVLDFSNPIRGQISMPYILEFSKIRKMYSRTPSEYRWYPNLMRPDFLARLACSTTTSESESSSNRLTITRGGR
ncbi:hypothetical protein Dsin_013215 [Dipteronia sinensis]|uniref:ADP-ribosyl cyclase/cyclic ADP-ribose hydrolase n=1 Tax=Dipteronia sinensis TaxID=43782 RepID=A0AAE0AKD5_9ROSI|nr:hypothetical protein Dsin_013215 [Dipteronia sinensis]